ncbi:AAA family ATPase [Amniculibacterium aquaticum]|uniref:AAA family ATPase n=1 Tax=Amniculibacterium aquaticum TaxID=2479858 RepID=UPI000F5A44D9|nr:ATP-binding protein [Amniculibacterium aquaticum]
MKLSDLANKLEISIESLKKFMIDFDLELNECMCTNFDVKEDFEKFALENVEFLQKFEKDLFQEKSAEIIAKTLQQPIEKVQEVIKKDLPNLFENGMYKSSVSTFGIDRKLGGDYRFVYNYFGQKSALVQRDFIGYRDLYFYITEVLDPFVNPDSVKEWGIHKPAGIVLYGPPGSGKIYWANKISELIEYKFKEVKKHYLGTSFVDGNKTGFNDFLVTMLKEEKVLLFLEDFDTIMMERNEEVSVSSDNEETKEIIMHYISKFEEENILMIGSAHTVFAIDDEVLAPGRFDVMIPVFPPNHKERMELVQYYMLENLNEDALLYKILINNQADHLPFWKEITSKMKLFSNTMIVDFTQSLKKHIKNQYKRLKKEDMVIGSNLLEAALRDAITKLTEEYLNQIVQFIQDVSINNYENFAQRIEGMKAELSTYTVQEQPERAIGFQHNGEKK